MAEELKSDGKEDMSIRQNMIDTAVTFLLNPSVKQRPNDAKIAFLQKKGLTDSEIAEAFNRLKYEAESAVESNKDNQLVNVYPLPPYQMPNSFWFHLRSYSSAFVSFAVAVYALHRFYKSFIEPWLFGSQSEKSELSALKQQVIDLNNSVSRLATTVTSLEEAVKNQIHYIDRVSLSNEESVPKSVRDVLDEVSNVKSLLLNRFSFPAPPALAGAVAENKTQNGDSKVLSKTITIPKWQLRDSELEKSKEQVEENGDNKKSTSEPTSLENGLYSVGDQRLDEQNTVEALENKNEGSKACLENSNQTQDKILDEDSKTAMKIQMRSEDDKTLNGDSGVELSNFLSDSRSTHRTNKPNGKIDDSIHHESAIKSE